MYFKLIFLLEIWNQFKRFSSKTVWFS